MGWGGTGWGKITSHSIGGDIALGNWRAHYNTAEDSIDILHPSDGIPYVKVDTTFSGVLTDGLEVVAGVLTIKQYPGWTDAIARDEDAYILDDATVWDDESGTGDQLIDYLFGSTQTAMYFEDGGTFVSDEIDLTKVQKYHSSKLEWALDAVPEGSTVVVQNAVSQNGTWGAYKTVAASGDALVALPAAESDLAYCKTRHKVTMLPTSDLSGAPGMSELKTTINSQKHFRVMADGVYKESQHIIDSVASATTETLT